MIYLAHLWSQERCAGVEKEDGALVFIWERQLNLILIALFVIHFFNFHIFVCLVFTCFTVIALL